MSDKPSEKIGPITLNVIYTIPCLAFFFLVIKQRLPEDVGEFFLHFWGMFLVFCLFDILAGAIRWAKKQ